MNTRPELLLLTRDGEFASRLAAAAAVVARVESAEHPEELEPRLSTLHSPALFLDLRRPDHEDVLAYYLAHPRRPVVVVETHPQAYGAAGVERIVAGLTAQGFASEPRGAKADTLVFGRGVGGVTTGPASG